MKRYACYMLIMAVAAVAACQKQPAVEEPTAQELEIQEPATPKTYTYTVGASIEDAEVKSNYDDDGKFSWSAGDAISVLFHNGDVNKFFTLTTTASGTASASFSGEIETGYVIGASDQTGEDKKIWALFPASTSHTDAAGELPKFFVQPEVDFSSTHFSANVPMYALNVAEGTLSFTNIAATYKFIVTGIKDGVNKVRFSVYNQTNFGLSGLWDIHNDSGTILLNYSYATPGSANSTLSYVSDVVSNQAVFYVSCHGTWGTFQPVVTVTNYSNGIPIKTFTASKSIKLDSMTSIKPITLNVSEANGGVYFTPLISIGGDFDDWDPSKNTSLSVGSNYKSVTGGGTYWKEFKVAYDERYIYFYVKRNYNAELWDGGYFWFKFDMDGNGTYDDKKFYIQPFKTVSETKTILSSVDAKDKTGTASASFSLSTYGVFDATDVIIEVMASREDIGLSKDATVGVQSTANKSAGDITITGLTFNN